MATFTALIPSGSSHGRPIKITATATPGNTIHTATSSSTDESVDEVYIWAVSTNNAGAVGTIHIGTVTDDEQSIDFHIPGGFGGPIAVLPGVRIRNSLVVTATASVAGRVNLFANVNRISAQ
jgi:NADP-dependent 3-hydroxy acid dehydrogenase YdfG